MPRLFSILIVTVFIICITACSSVMVPQVGAVAPCEIQSVAQVEEAIYASLAEQHWRIILNSQNIIQASKTVNKMSAYIGIVYGYRGFSIEYVDSQNMDYDVENDTINATYKKWVYNLMGSVQEKLKHQVELNPPVKCLGTDTPN